jgi:hypothetical protein
VTRIVRDAEEIIQRRIGGMIAAGSKREAAA